MLICKVCKGSPKATKCWICGAIKKKKSQKTIEEQAVEEHLQFLQQCFDKLCKSQAKTSGMPKLDEEIKRLFGNWIQKPVLQQEPQHILLYYQAEGCVQRREYEESLRLLKQVLEILPKGFAIQFKKKLLNRKDIELRIEEIKKERKIYLNDQRRMEREEIQNMRGLFNQ